MVHAQLRALLYCPGGEFMYRVFTTSTGEAITVVTKPAPNADTKWQGRLSVEKSSKSFYEANLTIFEVMNYCVVIATIVQRESRAFMMC